MENCTLYSHHIGFDKIESIIRAQLPKAVIKRQDTATQQSLLVQTKKGFLGRKYTITINYRQRNTPSYELTSINCPLTQNLMGMSNFVQSLPARNKTVQQSLLQKIATLNCEVSFMVNPYISEEFEQVLQQISQAFDGIIFAPPSSLFSKSNQQQFLDKELNLILDLVGVSEIDHLAVEIDSIYYDQHAATYTTEQINRKHKSEATLQKHQIKLNTNLPCIPSTEQINLRDKSEIINRIYALTVITAKAEGIPEEQIEQLISSKTITAFSPYEQHALDNGLPDKEWSVLTWRYESLFLLCWVIKKVDVLPYPSQMCDAGQFLSPVLQQSRAELEQSASLRTKEEVLDALDLIYRLNWACVDARINKTTLEGNIHPGIVYERHYALNWLTNYQNLDWDNVRTDT